MGLQLDFPSTGGSLTITGYEAVDSSGGLCEPGFPFPEGGACYDNDPSECPACPIFRSGTHGKKGKKGKDATPSKGKKGKKGKSGRASPSPKKGASGASRLAFADSSKATGKGGKQSKSGYAKSPKSAVSLGKGSHGGGHDLLYEVTFFVAGGPATASNSQEGKASVTGDAIEAAAGPVDMTCNTLAGDRLNVFQAIPVGAEVVFADVSFPEMRCVVTQGANSQQIAFHVSGSKHLSRGDQFGAVVISGFELSTGETDTELCLPCEACASDAPSPAPSLTPSQRPSEALNPSLAPTDKPSPAPTSSPTATPNAISGTLFLDDNADGTLELAETGRFNLVSVQLSDSGGVVATQVTDPSGDYRFDGLAAGTYTITVTDVSGILDGYRISVGAVPGADLNSQSIPYSVSLGAGNHDDRTGDFGYVLLTESPSQSPSAAPTLTKNSISGTVFVDDDGDGTLDPGETGRFEDIAVALLDAGGGPVAAIMTDSTGAFLFAGLAAGTYTIDIALPLPGYRLSSGASPGADLNSQTVPYAVTVGVGNHDDQTSDFGFVPLTESPTPEPTVFVPGTCNGVPDPGSCASANCANPAESAPCPATCDICTPFPTRSPTTEPPSVAPTGTPSVAPTKTPTAFPSTSPTGPPTTASPSSSPTAVPTTAAPSTPPTTSPSTATPTSPPSTAPTTAFPSFAPSLSPSTTSTTSSTTSTQVQGGVVPKPILVPPIIIFNPGGGGSPCTNQAGALNRLLDICNPTRDTVVACVIEDSTSVLASECNEAAFLAGTCSNDMASCQRTARDVNNALTEFASGAAVFALECHQAASGNRLFTVDNSAPDAATAAQMAADVLTDMIDTYVAGVWFQNCKQTTTSTTSSTVTIGPLCRRYYNRGCSDLLTQRDCEIPIALNGLGPRPASGPYPDSFTFQGREFVGQGLEGFSTWFRWDESVPPGPGRELSYEECLSNPACYTYYEDYDYDTSGPHTDGDFVKGTITTWDNRCWGVLADRTEDTVTGVAAVVGSDGGQQERALCKWGGERPVLTCDDSGQLSYCRCSQQADGAYPQCVNPNFCTEFDGRDPDESYSEPETRDPDSTPSKKTKKTKKDKGGAKHKAPKKKEKKDSKSTKGSKKKKDKSGKGKLARLFSPGPASSVQSASILVLSGLFALTVMAAFFRVSARATGPRLVGSLFSHRGGYEELAGYELPQEYEWTEAHGSDAPPPATSVGGRGPLAYDNILEPVRDSGGCTVATSR